MQEKAFSPRLPTPDFPVKVSGRVVHGKMLGRTLGTPTANIFFEGGACPVPHGIYASRVSVRGVCYDAVSNVGSRPTVDGADVNCETYIFDFSLDIYGEQIELTLYKRLREEQRFSSVEELRCAIISDVEAAKRFFSEFSFI